MSSSYSTNKAIGFLGRSIDKLNRNVCNIVELLSNNAELVQLHFCNDEGYIGSIIRVYDESTGSLSGEIYLDSSGNETAAPPGGEVCSGPTDYEYKSITKERCLPDGSGATEVLSIVYADGVELSTSTFWIVEGVKVETKPEGIVDCGSESCCSKSQEFNLCIDGENIPVLAQLNGKDITIIEQVVNTLDWSVVDPSLYANGFTSPCDECNQ